MKTCRTCAIPKPLDDFHKDSSAKDGHRSRCKVCAKAATAKWNREHPERSREHTRQWQAAHADRMRERAQQRYWSDPEKQRAQARAAYWSDPEKQRAARRARYARAKAARLAAMFPDREEKNS